MSQSTEAPREPGMDSDGEAGGLDLVPNADGIRVLTRRERTRLNDLMRRQDEDKGVRLESF